MGQVVLGTDSHHSWFDNIEIQSIQGTDDTIITALRSVLSVNSTIHRLHIDDISIHSKVCFLPLCDVAIASDHRCSCRELPNGIERSFSQ